MLPKEAIEEYKELCQRVLGVDMPTDEAERAANRLVGGYKVVYAPDLLEPTIRATGIVGEYPDNKTDHPF